MQQTPEEFYNLNHNLFQEPPWGLMKMFENVLGKCCLLCAVNNNIILD